jgi:hypothetical protein
MRSPIRQTENLFATSNSVRINNNNNTLLLLLVLVF